MEEVLKILEEYKNSNRYISCLEDIYVLFEKYSISFKDRISVLQKIDEHNQRIYEIEGEKTQTVLPIPNKTIMDNEKEEDIIEEKVSKVNSPLIVDIKSYLLNISKAITHDEIVSCLPKKDDVNYGNIVNSILIRLYKDKVEIINFLNQENNKEITEAFDDELTMLDFKIETILDYINEVIEEEVYEPGNRIMFLKNSSQEPYIFQTLKGYEEYYGLFLELLNSIINGRFKRKRYFVNHGKIINIYEVGSFEARILFTGIKENTYVVLSAFMKKCNHNLQTHNFVENSSSKFQAQKDFLLSMFNNEEYMQQEQVYLQQLTDMLSERVKVKKNENN